MSHEVVEKNTGVLIDLTLLVVSVAMLVEILPLFFLKDTTEPVGKLATEPAYNALQIEGRDVYVREGCYNCHSQMIRPFRAETERYGRYDEIIELARGAGFTPARRTTTYEILQT